MEFKFKLFDGQGHADAAISLDMYKHPGGLLAAVDAAYPVVQGVPPASDQLRAQCGFFRVNDPRSNVQAASVRSILDGMSAATAPGGTGISRFVAPAAILAGVQNDIYEDRAGVLGQFRNLTGIFQSVAGNRYERPVFNYDAARNSRAKPVAQLSEPTAMGLLTVGETSGTIPTFSYGLEVSDQAMDYFTYAEVQKCVSIMVTQDMADRADDWLLSMLNGDSDHGMSALSGVTAQSFDAAIVAAGNLTQRAWMKWIAAHAKRAPITHIITDIDGALAIQNRTGRPNFQSDNPSSNRIDTLESVMNDQWPSELPVFIVTDSSWPANTILGISKPNAIIMYESATANYNSVEQFVTRRSTKFRADFGATAGRFYDRAFHVMTLTV